MCIRIELYTFLYSTHTNDYDTHTQVIYVCVYIISCSLSLYAYNNQSEVILSSNI